MSITALVTRKLLADPDRRVGGSRRPFVLARLVAHDGEAGAFVSLIAFGSVAEQLAALSKGDAVAVTGRASVNTCAGREGETKAGLNVTVDALLTAYHLRRKRLAMSSDPGLAAEQGGSGGFATSSEPRAGVENDPRLL